jgi:DNA-binding response OmpR family regulator
MTEVAPRVPVAKIVVADDDQSLVQTLTWILREHNYEVLVAPGGEGLVTLVEEERPHLLLLDVMMPKVDGLQLLERLKGEAKSNSRVKAELGITNLHIILIVEVQRP